MRIEQLHSIFLKSTGVNTDTRKIQVNNLFFALKGEHFDGNQYAEKACNSGAIYAVIDDEKFHLKNGKSILVDDVLETLQLLANYHRNYLSVQILALTGSNGKTTTKELISSVLKQRFNIKATSGNLNNHIGVPLTLLSMDTSTELGIVEMGANHLGEIAQLCKIAEPDYGYVTNFGKAHLEGFGGVEGIIKGKSELYDYLKSNNKIAFVNKEDQIQLEKTKEIKQYSFGVKNSKSDVAIQLIESNPFVKVKFFDSEMTTNLIGMYNFSNISAALAIGHYFKVPIPLLKKGIESYIPENNRSQLMTKGTNKLVLDAYNANPTSLRAAIETFNEMDSINKVVILGDMFELGSESQMEHQEIVNFVEKLNFKRIYLIGKNFYKTTTNNSLKYEDFNQFSKYITQNPLKNAHILIKGSRGMALERVLDLI